MNNFNLLGHACPTGQYPSIVLPVGLLTGQGMAVIYEGGPGKDCQPDFVSDEQSFVRLRSQALEELIDFDPEEHRLFAFSEENITFFTRGNEREFFGDFLDGDESKNTDQFVRLALARLTGEASRVMREMGRCMVALQGTPEFLLSWCDREVGEFLGVFEGLATEAAGSTILLIENHLGTAQAVKAHFESDNYRVLVARDGIRGLAVALDDLPDVIILDLHMPYMDGYEVLTRLGQYDDTRRIPVIVWSQYAEEWGGKDEFGEVPIVIGNVRDLGREVRRVFLAKSQHDTELLDELVEMMVA